MGTNDDEEIVIKGIVTPHNWDEAGKVTAIAISAPEEEEYVVDETSIGHELIGFIHEQVKIRGKLRRDALGNKIVSVARYEVIDTGDEHFVGSSSEFNHG